jgi:hypothetical protein
MLSIEKTKGGLHTRNSAGQCYDGGPYLYAAIDRHPNYGEADEPRPRDFDSEY